MADFRFAAAFAAKQPASFFFQQEKKDGTHYTASAMVPIDSEGSGTIGWLVVDIDQTERAELFSSIADKVAIVVALLLAAAPAFGFWYRARHRADMERTIDQLSKRDALTGFRVKSALQEEIEQHLAEAPKARQH